MTRQISLYGARGVSSLVPHALLCHLSLPFTPIEVKHDPNRKYSAADGSFTHAEFLCLNPAGWVPVLRLDDEIITEMPAVLSAIARLAPDEGLLGRTPAEINKVNEWMAWLSGTVHGTGFAAYWNPHRFIEDRPDLYPLIKANGLKVVERSFERIEQRLDGKRFAVGEGLTTVDFNLYVFSRWAGHIGIQLDEKYPAYAALALGIEKMEAVRRALQDTGLERTFRDDGSFCFTPE